MYFVASLKQAECCGLIHGFQMSDQKTDRENRIEIACDRGAEGTRVCPVCRGETLIEIRGKLQCERCHTICETCCEGGRG
ncbi:MAG: hypothetical protein CMM05_07600 [Rhodopirellula sp.]|nr:hypothetical protein [Rhodopirellula sp.]